MKKILITILLLLPMIAYASKPIYTIYPSYEHQGNKQWIILEAAPGNTITDHVTVENLTEKQVTLNLEFNESTGEPNEFTIIENQDYKDIGNWVKFPQSEITLNPKEKRKIDITINIPKTIEEKEYQGVILATNKQNSDNDINIVTRIGTRIYLDIKNNQDLQINTFNLKITTLQTVLIIISLIGIGYSLKRKNEKTNN